MDARRRVKATAASLAVLALALATGGCGEKAAQNQQAGQGTIRQQQRAPGPTDGLTPMNERVAVLGLLNKRNGIVRDLTLRPGQAVKVKDAIVRLRACETTAPWENERLTGAFVQLDVQRPDSNWDRVFSGWLYKETPSLNVVEHPAYDVWPKSCAMRFPGAAETAPEEEPAASNASSA